MNDGPNVGEYSSWSHVSSGTRVEMHAADEVYTRQISKSTTRPVRNEWVKDMSHPRYLSEKCWLVVGGKVSFAALWVTLVSRVGVRYNGVKG